MVGFVQSVNAQDEKNYTVVVSLYQPNSFEKSELLEEILMTQIAYYLESSMSWQDNKILLKDSPKKTVSKLDDLVKEDVRFHDYEALEDFKGFSETVLKKIENITGRTYDVQASQGLSLEQNKISTLDYELTELKRIIKTELFVFGEKDQLEVTKEVYSDLTQEGKG